MLALGSLPLAINVFAVNKYYVNANYQARVQASIQQAWVDASTRQSLQSMVATGSAFWIDTISRIKDPGHGVTLETLFRDAAAQPVPPLVVAILYDLPNRDCHASASNGELCCQFNSDGTCVYEASDPTCSDGLARYQHHYVDPFAAVLEKYSSVPVAVVIEPDSLPNLATNMEDPRCGNAATQTAYIQGITYAIDTLHRRAPRAALYLDAGHGGWLGWPDKADDFLRSVGRLGPSAAHLRGFATNVANYQSLGSPCPAPAFFDEGWPQLGQQYCAQHSGEACCRDPCSLLTQYNSANNEHNYVQLLAARARRSQLNGLLPSPRFIIDTGRNGRDNMRQDCANWCNIRGAAVGRAPTAQTALPDLIDAYYWLKTPGESDGCTQTLPNGEQCARYDGSCGSVDSIGSRMGEPRAPEAGAWFASQLAELSCRASDNSGTNGTVISTLHGADERCPEVVQKATVVAEEEAALAPPEPVAPRYDWQQSTASDGTGRVGMNAARPVVSLTPAGITTTDRHDEQTESCACHCEGWGTGLLLVVVVSFAVWFVYPRCEPRIRRQVGEERYTAAWGAAWAVACIAAARLRAGAETVAGLVMRARTPGASVFSADAGHRHVATSQPINQVDEQMEMPTATDHERDEFDVIE